MSIIKENIQGYQLGLRNNMAKRKPLFGVNTYIKKTKIKRPGRHAKRTNKNKKRTMKKYIGQGR